jgi:hypothetical protein
MGFVDRKAGWEAYNEYAADTYLVRAVLCSGMYPQIVGVTVRLTLDTPHLLPRGKDLLQYIL